MLFLLWQVFFFAESFHAVAGCLHGTIPPPLGATLVFVPDESAYFAP
jgi:hypothetical protein